MKNFKIITKLKFVAMWLITILIFSLNSCSDESDVGENPVKVKILRIEKIAKDLNVNLRHDTKVNESNSIVFKSEQDLIAFIKKTQKNSTENSELEAREKNTIVTALKAKEKNTIVTMGKCADGIYDASAMTAGVTTLIFDVSVTNGCISGISGGFTGWTLGVSYTQGGTTFGCSSGSVCGTVNYNLFLEGIGTVYSQRVCYHITLNC